MYLAVAPFIYQVFELISKINPITEELIQLSSITNRKNEMYLIAFLEI